MGPMIQGVMLTQLTIVPVAEGDILHVIKPDSPGYASFGEAYFSTILPGRVKAWKKHLRMTLNLTVPEGRVRFVIFDDRKDSPSFGQMESIILSRNNYARLTVPPGLWLGFQCMDDVPGLILNIADLAHDPAEAERLQVDAILFNWSQE